MEDGTMADISQYTTTLTQMLDFEIAGNTGNQFLLAFIVFVGFTILLKIVKTIILVKLKQLTERTENNLDDLLFTIIQEIPWSFYTLVSIYASLSFLTLNEFIQSAVGYGIIIIFTYYGVKVIQTIIEFSKERVIKERTKSKKTEDVSLIGTLAEVLKISTWVFAFVLLLANFGYDISALIAGLGIGGLAIALAAQNILSDIFASFSIYFDKPFKVGDYVVVGDDSGTVKKIGIKSTRVETLKGDELILSNKELTSSRIHNYGKMTKRRIVFHFGVVYGTPSKKLRKIPAMVKDVIKSQDKAEADRVHFTEFGDFSLNFEAVYYVDSPQYVTYMDIQQAINLSIKERFEKEKIEMAFPTQTIYVEK
ncbi:MAG: mechanosensitive ion channel family protein [Candidatus Micrarchaeota archaeon]